MLETIKAVFTLIPLISALLVQVEGVIPMSGKGKEKLEAVKLILLALNEGYGALWPAISAVITGLVSLYNKVGWPKPTLHDLPDELKPDVQKLEALPGN